MLGNGRKKDLIINWIPHIYVIPVLVGVCCARSSIPSATNEWNKLPTILLTENASKATRPAPWILDRH